MKEAVRKYSTSWAVLAACLVILISLPTPAMSEETSLFERMWLTEQQPWYSGGPRDLAIDSSGNVVDFTYNRTQKFTSDGTFVTKWGSEGSGDGEFNNPMGIAIDSDGVVYVTDTLNNRIQKFTSDGTFITKWGNQGSDNGEFWNPDGIAIDADGDVYVADFMNNRIQKFTSDGTFVTKWGNFGSGDGEFFSPTAIATDADGDVYVADFMNNRIQKFTSDGTFVTKWGSEGSGDGEFWNPDGLTIDGNGNVYVADGSNHRIQKFTSDQAFITKWGNQGSAEGEFDYPGKIAIGGSGNVYVADTRNNRIQKFSTDGTFITKWESGGSADSEFNSPYGIAIDASGNVYVADTGNNRIQKFVTEGFLVTSDPSELWIRAMINTEEKGSIEAVWQKGGEDTTSAGDQVIWGHFYADPDDVTWGSENNPDLFVKIWFDHGGRLDVNFFHVSVPDIVVYSDYPYDANTDEQGTTTMSTRYIRQFFENGQSDSEEQNEDGNPPAGFSPSGDPTSYGTINDLNIGAMINTEEMGGINAIWQLGGTDTTAAGDQVVWGHFYASPNDVTWGNADNPDLFVKIWFDNSGRIDVNFFHVSVPEIEVYSDYPEDGSYDQAGTTIMSNRYIRQEYLR